MRPYFLRSTTRAVAGQEAFLLERRAQLRLEIGQRLGEAVAHRAGLAGEAAARDRDDDVVLVDAVGDLQRLLQDHAQHGTGEIDCSSARSLTVILPEPGLIQTRATASLRLPVA